METIKKNVNPSPVKKPMPIDPRIDSPQIKVVYPVPPIILKDLPEQETTQPSAPIQPTAPVTQEAPVGQTTATNTTTPHTTTPAQGWQETIKQNSMLFIIFGLLALGIGFMIGKSKG